ncbi:MAG: cytochrome-c peroxidase, partial [Pirellulaceae bacterium]
EEPLDLGRFEVTDEADHKGQFKTPTLRNVGMTAPYMHDGSIATLREVVEFYNKGGGDNPHLDSRMKSLNLTEQEIDDLVAFLKALDGRYAWEAAVVEQRVEEDGGAGSD